MLERVKLGREVKEISMMVMSMLLLIKMVVVVMSKGVGVAWVPVMLCVVEVV